jgi:hypothetical protein
MSRVVEVLLETTLKVGATLLCAALLVEALQRAVAR